MLLGTMSLTVNRLVRRKLRLSVALLVAFVASDLVLMLWDTRLHLSGETISELGAFSRLAVAAAIINAVVVLVINPLREDRVPDRFPTILQDAVVLALVLLASTFLSQQLLTTSAVSAVVLGFALQDTLGNAFAGLAIQSERPFHVGHWVKIADFEGRVVEVTWRATKLRTKAGNLVVVPNNVVSKEAITNYSQPAAPMRLSVDVGASYLTAPNQVKAAILEAVRHCTHVLQAPAPDVVLQAFDASAIAYKARFWISDFGEDELARDEVRTAIYYSFQRHGIEIPWPIQIEYSRDWKDPDPRAKADAIERVLTRIDLFAGMPPEFRRELALAAGSAVYGAGETVVRQGDPGQSMFVVAQGTVAVLIEETRTEVARIEAGGYFGEMSLLTGDPRTATVLAVGDVEVIEIGADLFRRFAAVHPEALERIGAAALARRAGLEAARSAVNGAAATETATFMSRMKKFLRVG
ncbi:MAG TPA: mechanosensitive ion channel family protein [Vicinamibacterales bacterium]